MTIQSCASKSFCHCGKHREAVRMPMEKTLVEVQNTHSKKEKNVFYFL